MKIRKICVGSEKNSCNVLFEKRIKELDRKMLIIFFLEINVCHVRCFHQIFGRVSSFFVFLSGFFINCLGQVVGHQIFASDLYFVQLWFEAAYFDWMFLWRIRLDFRHTQQESRQPIFLATVQQYLIHLLIRNEIH